MVPLMFSDSPSEPLLRRLGSTDQSHPFLQPPLWAWMWLPRDNGPLKEPAERQDSGPQSISEGWRQREDRLSVTFLQCSGKSELYSQGSKVLLENSLIFQNSVASSPKTDALRAELTYSLSSSTSAPREPSPSMNSSASDCKVQTLALVKTCLALMPEQYLVRETVSSYIHISR